MPWGPFFVGIAFVLIGSVVMLRHVLSRRKMNQPGRFAETTGTITRLKRTGLGAKVRVVGEAKEQDSYRKYRVDLEFTYKVDGKPYRSDRVSFNSAPFVKQEVDALFARFQEGMTTPVLFERGRPEFAVLMKDRPGGKPHSDFWMGMITTLAGISTLVAVLAKGN